jgi:20S proteasome alpha/beta subunit
MTAIAYKDGVMAGDSASWQGDILVGYHKKVFKTPKGWLTGCAGSVEDIIPFRAWMLCGAEGKIPKVRELSALLVDPDGNVFYARSETGMKPTPASHKEIGAAIGMGREFILGIMAQGGSAEEAIRLAAKRVAYVRGRVYTVSLD